MIVFELEDENLYSARITHFDILKESKRLDVYIYTNRGSVIYRITASINDEMDLFDIRDTIAAQLLDHEIKIIERPEAGLIIIGESSYRGERLKTDFLPQ